MNKMLGIVFSFLVIFTESYSANQFTVVNTTQSCPVSVEQAQLKFIQDLAFRQGIEKFPKKNYQIDLDGFSKANVEIIGNKQKISLLWNQYIHTTIELPNLSVMISSKNQIDEIVKIVTSSRDYLNYSARRTVDSMTIKVEKNGYTVFLSNGESDEGTVFSIDFKN